MKLIIYLTFLSAFPLFLLGEGPISTGYYSLQPKKEPVNSTNSMEDPPTSKNYSEIHEIDNDNYLIYEITTPSLGNLYKIDDFDIDLHDKYLSLRGKVRKYNRD